MSGATARLAVAVIGRFGRGVDLFGPCGGLDMLAGFLGVALLVTPGGAGRHFDIHFVIGALVIQVGSIGWQLGSVRGKYHLGGVPLLVSASLQMLFGGAILTVIGFATGEGSRFA